LAARCATYCEGSVGPRRVFERVERLLRERGHLLRPRVFSVAVVVAETGIANPERGGAEILAELEVFVETEAVAGPVTPEVHRAFALRAGADGVLSPSSMRLDPSATITEAGNASATSAMVAPNLHKKWRWCRSQRWMRMGFMVVWDQRLRTSSSDARDSTCI
jgi:hypothetical protein